MGRAQRHRVGMGIVAVTLFALSSLAGRVGSATVPPLPHLHLRRIVSTEPDLIKRARPVARFRGNDVGHTHQWLSPYSLFMVHAVYEAEQVDAEIVNTQTGKHQPLKAVNRFLSHVREWSYRSCEVSPDGNWLLEHDRGGSNLMRLDGSHLRHIEDGGRWVSVCWQDDSVHWLNFYGGYNGHFLDYKEVTRYSRYSRHPERSWKELPDTSRDSFLTNSLVKASYKHSEVLLCYASPGVPYEYPGEESENNRQAKRIIIRRRPINSLRKPVVVSQFALPNTGRVMGATISPTGRRIAWILRASSRATLYTSALDGTKRVLIGSLACDDGKECPEDLMWLPGDRHLSFVYQNTVYTVPAS